MLQVKKRTRDFDSPPSSTTSVGLQMSRPQKALAIGLFALWGVTLLGMFALLVAGVRFLWLSA